MASKKGALPLPFKVCKSRDYLLFFAFLLPPVFLAAAFGFAAAFLGVDEAVPFGIEGILARPSTMSFNSCPARNTGTLAASIRSFCLGFCGFTPVRAWR